LAGHGGFLVDEWRCIPDKFGVVSGSRDDLDLYMRQEWDDPEGTLYSFTQRKGWSNEALPHGKMSASVTGRQGGQLHVANSVVVDLEVGANVCVEHPLPVGWLLGQGVGLVQDFVDVWRPDAVSLDCTELLDAQETDAINPVVGFVSWLSDDVSNPGIERVDAYVNHRYSNGTVLGIDPASADPLGDALGLVDQVVGGGLIRPIPFIQGEPHPA
jgi:hypothetical protein